MQDRKLIRLMAKAQKHHIRNLKAKIFKGIKDADRNSEGSKTYSNKILKITIMSIKKFIKR